VIITERNGVLVVRVVVQEPQGDREQEQEQEEEIESETEDTRPEPTTFTEDADVVERDCAPPAA
jgi:DNA topoisomerase VI subunit B